MPSAQADMVGIGAEIILPAANQAATSAEEAPATLADDSASRSASELFTLNCASCHAQGGNIIRRGKTLQQKALNRNGYGDVSAIARLITEGKGVMPAYADRLSAGEISAIAQYVVQQAKSGW
jgi:cytochrome c6